jgi:hypothetical protein
MAVWQKDTEAETNNKQQKVDGADEREGEALDHTADWAKKGK